MTLFTLLATSSLLSLVISCRRPTLGVTNGKFKPCPSSPNCVSSMANDTSKKHYQPALKIVGSKEESYQSIKAVLAELPRMTIVTDDMPYLHVEFQTKIMRFVDDVEFYFDETSGLIHYRSASRVGYSDLGLNRERMQDINKRYYRLVGSNNLK